MAASVSAWAKPGAWALDSEEQEAELLQKKDKDDTSQFPSLAVAAATKPKKKKAQAIPLADFTTYGGPKPSHSDSLTHEDLMMLPTGPRQRTAEELERDRGRLGGGFRSYGSYDRPNRNSGGDESSNSRWGSSRVSDEPRRNGSFGRDSNREMTPSRADEIDNWAAAKKSTVGNGFERRDRDRGGFSDSQSRADESDSWVSNKNYVPSEGRRFGSNGGGFERERKVGFGSSGGADSDNWNRKKGEFNVGGGIDRIETPSGRPRLNLQPRSLPLSSESQEGSGNVAKPKGPNPFGDARPREEVLAEKGQDWKKIDEQLDAMKIKETVDKKEGLGRRGFGSGNAHANLPEERAERSWRKAVSDDSRPTSAGKSEDGHVEEN
ncbi:eukaryotic translation initiation factor 4B3 isoform X2 [Neltuma alba]|uniref:eukaryotic translation initiation factor 4B3 isoform X2 n=1 Tax=Neltuma alba TaxID=207710 RepID=UPI0010A4D28B|nr:eukaryotic translation initiation factor 4B3-like isoform X2 [Prosopis alba]